MTFKQKLSCIYCILFVFSRIYSIQCVNIAKLKEMNKYQNLTGIGPPCGNKIPPNRQCTLDNEKPGQCAELCKTPNTIDAKICCHIREPDQLYVFYCCEKSEYLGRTLGVNGVVTAHNEFPYMAALGWYSKKKMFTYDYKCGAALISKKFAVTAAHCSYIDGTEPIVVLPGGLILTDDYMMTLTIETVHVHPDYDDEFVYNDIALIQLVGEHRGATIDIWRRSYIANESFAATGYGDTTFGGTSSDVLIKVFLQYFPTNDCQRFYSEEDNVPNGIKNTQLCAKDPKNKMDTCQGDSGGPLIMMTYNNNGNEKKDYLMGVTSFGLGCASLAPGVYTQVSAYIQWINKIAGQMRTEKNKGNKTKNYWS